MTILDIRRIGDPVLRTRAAEVTDFDTELRTLVRDLTESMLDAPGVGLAAPQLGVGLRVFTYHVDGVTGYVVNPVLKLDGDLEEVEEGCLSIPGLTALPARAPRAVATGFDQHGEPVRIEGTALLAQCFQHETDHLDGVLFIDRLDTDERRRALKVIRSSDWAGDVRVQVSPHDSGRIR